MKIIIECSSKELAEFLLEIKTQPKENQFDTLIRKPINNSEKNDIDVEYFSPAGRTDHCIPIDIFHYRPSFKSK